MYDDVIRTVENGRPCGTIVKERKLANDNDDIMIFTNRIVETGLECERRFKRIKQEPIMYWKKLIKTYLPCQRHTCSLRLRDKAKPSSRIEIK